VVAAAAHEVSMSGKKAFLVASLVVILALGALAATSGKVGEGRYKLIGLFSQVVSLVRSSYVEEVSVAKLEEGALSGLVTTADPQGTWVPEAAAAEVRAYFARPLPPFGLVLGWQSSYPVVLQVLPGSAAAAAGILPGELIERVGDQPVRARPLWRLLAALEQKAQRREAVQLEVIARDLSTKRTVLLTGAEEGNPAPTVEPREGVHLVRLPVVAAVQVKKLAAALPGDGPVVLDLRGTALGDPQGAVDAVALLLGGDVELALRSREGETQVSKTSKPPVARKVAVCVDHTTARAGEWLAYLLSQRGVPLVGVETFGDTAQRAARPVADGELWIAKRLLFTPDGKPILGKGLKPTHLVRPQREGDPILDKALELVRGQAQAQAA
jgi:carboxyl-terminal processing protease